MSKEKIIVLVCLDLVEDVYRSVSHYVGQTYGHGESTVVDIEDIKRGDNPSPASDIVAFFFFSRRNDPELKTTMGPTGVIGQSFDVLTSLQLKQNVISCVLVDCAERPAAPLSEFNALAHFLEGVSDNAPTDTATQILALDYDMDDAEQPTAISIVDTQSKEFLKISAAYTEAAIASLLES